VAEFDSVIPAGGTGTLTAKVHTRSSQSGAVSKSVAVTTSDPAAPRIMLGVNFNIVAAVSVLPQPRIYLHGIDGDRPETSLLLRRDDGEPLEITGIDASGGRLVLSTTTLTEARKVGAVEGRAGDVVVHATVDPDLPASSANGTVRVRTNHPDAPSIDIFYSLRMRPVIESRPARVVLVLERGNKGGRAALTRLQHNRGASFTVTGLRPSDPSLFRADLLGEPGSLSIHSVTVRLVDGVEPGAFTGRKVESLVISTDNEQVPELRLPVLVEARAPRVSHQQRPSG
jgi:hypothetical protein